MIVKSLPVMRILSALLVWSAMSDGVAVSAPLISTVSATNDVTNFGPSGLGLGKLGYWFPNFNAKAPSVLAPVNTNLVSTLPTWLKVEYNSSSPTYSFAKDSPSSAFSTGGIAGYNTFTLPNGTTGLSGQLVDHMQTTTTQSNTIIPGFGFGAGAPKSFLVSVILDNAPLSALTSVSRLRASNSNIDGTQGQQADFTGIGTGVGKNGIADVYQFLLSNVELNGFLKIQLRSPGAPAGADTGLGGILLDPVLLGDANFDGLVDGADYTRWADHFLQSNVGYENGDFSGDGVVDGADYTIWADHFKPAALSAVAVPEPSGIVLGAVGASLLGCIAAVRRRRRTQLG